MAHKQQPLRPCLLGSSHVTNGLSKIRYFFHCPHLLSPRLQTFLGHLDGKGFPDLTMFYLLKFFCHHNHFICRAQPIVSKFWIPKPPSSKGICTFSHPTKQQPPLASLRPRQRKPRLINIDLRSILIYYKVKIHIYDTCVIVIS